MNGNFMRPMNPGMGGVPMWQGDTGAGTAQSVGGGQMGGSGGQGGLAGLAGSQMGGYKTYLEGLGWNGAPGTRMEFAQGLREQGQHPFMDYWHSIHPQGSMGGATQGNGAGGGINPNPGGYDGSGINPGGVFSGGNFPGAYGPPHTMAPPVTGGSYGAPQGIAAQNGLGSLARRQPFIQR